jgi:3-dehydrosphinganine reductase
MGRGLAKLCAQKGANVIIVARNVDKLKAALEYVSVRTRALPPRPN